ncbi:MAG TPA: hypothetical protein VHP33_35510 [Polyangiaceae bacterium]|nr:hypothetical protein [Polyangiaceae bacterium]
MIPDPVDIIYCEVCELPHRRGARVCEECQHRLGTEPNWGQLRVEVSEEGVKALAGFAVTLVVASALLWLFDRTWLLGTVPMLGWSLTHARRWRAISKRLAKQVGPQLRG